MLKHNIFDGKAQGHACFLYESADERLKLIAAYFEEGLANHELCVFVTPESPDEVIDAFLAVGVDITDAITASDMRIFAMEQTYLPDGQFGSDFMLQNVRNFMEDAKQLGYSGLRTAGEMSWLQNHPEFVTDAIDYEGNVNSLSQPGSHFTGLCLYPVEQVFSGVLAGAMRTHPSFIYDGSAHANHLYKTVAA